MTTIHVGLRVSLSHATYIAAQLGCDVQEVLRIALTNKIRARGGMTVLIHAACAVMQSPDATVLFHAFWEELCVDERIDLWL